MSAKRLLIRIWDRLYFKLFYRPWTPEQIRDRVALSVANTCYRSWHGQVDGPVPTAPFCHSFTELTTGDAEPVEGSSVPKNGPWVGYTKETRALNIYVASSWRNERQPEVVLRLRDAGYDIYDFRNPGPGKNGFHWSEIDPNWKQWAGTDFLSGIMHPIAQAAFDTDMNALKAADVCVLVMPCGRSAHLEAGYAVGAGKPTFILLDDQPGESELMYKMTDVICLNMDELLAELNKLEVLSLA